MTNLVTPIAIVGIAVEIPSGRSADRNLSHDSFFDFLLNKKQAYEEFPAERFNVNSYRGPNLGQTITTTGSFLKDISLFDPTEFGITAKDAMAMAVGTRKLIETAFLALLDSGIDYRGRNVGTYMSAVALDALSMTHADVYDPRGSFAGYPYMVANKVSYHLDLLGPSIPVDTACSSTMTALHLAVQALRSGDCESAVVGGCQLNHRKVFLLLLDFIQYSQGSVLAPDGKCKPFDASANGFSRGEGVGAVVLKPLEAAIRDGDYVYASILGTGVNSAGSAGPVSAPVAEAQMDAMHRAYVGTGRLPCEVDYIELHATGTAAGDPIEANWVGSEFRREDELLVGSVKGNIGHLEIMSFIASLSKVCSIFRSRIIPSTVNLNTPNPAIRWDEYRMRAPIEQTPLNPRHPSGKALISITSSGIGGSNGHAVLEGPPTLPVLDQVNDPVHFPVLFIAAGLSPRSATDIGDTLVELIPCHDPRALAGMSNIYGRRSRQMSWRSAAVYVPNQMPIKFPPPRFSPRKKRPVVFVFSGQGPQHFEMGRQLFKNYAPFRESIKRMDQIYMEDTGTSLIQQTGLFADSSALEHLPEIWPISITLPALAMLHMALCDLFAAVGIIPDVVVGHSAGETAVLYASGAASQTMALRLAIARGLAMSLVEGAGSMAAIACDGSAAQDLINGVVKENPDGILEIACYNAHDSVTLAGTTNLIDQVIVRANSRGFFARKLRTNVPVHSGLMELCKQQYQERVHTIFDGDNNEHRPLRRTYSSFTGQLWEDPFSAEYFWSNTRMPVLFSHAIGALLQDTPNASFIEISPHPVLGSYIESFNSSLSVIVPMRRSKVQENTHEVHTFLAAIGNLIVDGYNVANFTALIPQNTPVAAVKISTPPYPFVRRPIPYQPDLTSASIDEEQRKGPLNGLILGLNALTHPALAQHVIRNEAIMPAAGYLEMAFEFGARYLWNVQFENIMPLFSDRVLRVQILQEGHFWSVRSWKLGPESNNAAPGVRPTRLHACGYMSEEIPRSNADDLDLKRIRDRCSKLDIGGFYERMTYFAQFGAAYQRVTGCYIADSEGLLRIRASVEDLTDEGKYYFNPVVLDSCLHALVHPAFTRNLDKSVYYLPSSVQRVSLHKSFIQQKLPSTLYAYAELRQWNPESIIWDLCITDEHGSRICTLTRLCLSLHQISPRTHSESRFKLVYQVKGNRQRCTTSSFESAPAAHISDHSLSFGIGIAMFRDILKTIIHVDHKQVIRILVLNFGPPNADVEAAYRNRRDLPESALLDYTFGTFTETQNGVAILPENVRKIQYNSTSTRAEPGLSPSTFDIIVALDISTELHHEPPSRFMENMNRLLHPGGYLVVGLVDEAAQSISEVKGGSLWQQTAFNGNFSRVELHSDATNGHHSFVLEAQKPSWAAFPWNSVNTDTPVVIDFALDHVLQYQQAVRECDGASLWINATSGIDDAAALGFSRSLRREMHSTKVYLVLFDPIWTPKTRLSIIRDLAGNPDVEVETLIDTCGHARVPRLIHCTSKVIAHELNFEQYWSLKSGALLVEPLPPLLDGHVLVRITHLAFTIDGLQGFVGRITNPGSTAWAKEDFVVGVMDSDRISNHFLVHEGQIAAAPDPASRNVYAACAVPLVLFAISVDPESIRTPSRLRGRKFLVTNANEPMGQWLTTILLGLGVAFETSIGQPTEIPLEAIHQSHFIFCGYSSQEDIQVIQSAMNPDALIVCWTGSAVGRGIRRNPWMVGDALASFNHLNIQPPADFEVMCGSPEEHLARKCPSHVDIQIPLFHSEKSYLLIGGIGSLGLSIAWWMYQRGARHIILTSRSGEASLTRDKNVSAARLLSYLRSLPCMDLRLEECDATSRSATTALVRNILPPVAGCMLLAVVFSDRAFSSHTKGTFYIPFAGKEGALRVLEEAFPISSLDFLVNLSSVTGLFGSPGQTNYAGANTSLEALIQSHSNAFSVIAPAILNSNFMIDLKNLSSDSRFKMWTAWGITSQRLCDSIGDGILALNHGSADKMYLPDVDWEELQHQLGDSPMYAHFLKGPQASREALSETSRSSLIDSVRQMALKVLDVDPSEFSPNIPFTSYGLDSLSAGRLAFMLRPYLSITQVQLLSDMSLADLHRQIEVSEQKSSDEEANRGRFNWSALNQSGQTVVPLVDGDGPPLIVIHGTSGNIVALFPLQERFNSPLWAIQTTPETPLGSIEEMSMFYFREIKAMRPVGPYRLAGFSGISLITFHLALLFEWNGDHVVQLVMLDHFPTLFSLPSLFPLDDETVTTNAPSGALISQCFSQLFGLYARDPSPSRQVILERLTDLLNGRSVDDPIIRSYYEVFIKILTMVANFVLNGFAEESDGSDLRARMERWVTQVKAPVTVIVAKKGTVVPIPEWDDLGCRACFPDARVTYIDSGHFSMLEMDTVVDELQHGW